MSLFTLNYLFLSSAKRAMRCINTNAYTSYVIYLIGCKSMRCVPIFDPDGKIVWNKSSTYYFMGLYTEHLLYLSITFSNRILFDGSNASRHTHVCVSNGNFSSIHSKENKRTLDETNVHTSTATACAIVPLQYLVLLIRFRSNWTWTLNTLIVLLTWYYTQKIVLFLDLWMFCSERIKNSLEKHKILTRTSKSTIFFSRKSWLEARMMTTTTNHDSQ